MNKPILLLLSSSCALMANGSELEIEIPQLDVAEYHRPYVSVWVQSPDNKHIMDVALWYQTSKKKNKKSQGTKWLKDLRKWWRHSGRDLKFPVDGLSSPTKPPGKHSISLNDKLASLPPLQEGHYELFVEAAREVGGRETLSIPFQWDGETLKIETNTTVTGEKELKSITLKQQP